MNIEEIKRMAASSGADAWEITCRDRKDWEFYFIRHKLDQNRVVDVEHIDMKVYKKNRDQTLVGTASAEIAPTASAGEVKQQIADLLYRASLVQNPVFELRSPGENESAAALMASEDSARTNTEEDAQEGCSIAGAARDFIEVMKELPETEETYVNSYEIFTKENTVRFINSKGIDVTQKYPASFLEVVLNARDREHEIELYRSYDSGTCDREGLKEDLIRSFRTGIDRLHTQPTPAFESLPVVFATPDAVSIYKYFLDNLSAGQLYMKSSQWKIGEAIAKDMEGDRLTIRSLRYLPNSSCNLKYDSEGALVRDCVLMRDAVPENFWGSRMYSEYLGLKNSFLVTNYSVSGGTGTPEQLRTGRYLEAAEFSDFQVDTLSGDIFGEIRLAYLHDDDKVIPVSGGSVSGNMKDLMKHMSMSREQRQYNNARIPAVTRFENVTIAGDARR